MVYAAIVRQKVRAVFAAVNAGDGSAMVSGLADDFVYLFHGERALDAVAASGVPEAHAAPTTG